MTTKKFTQEEIGQIYSDLQLSGMQFFVKFIGSMVYDNSISAVDLETRKMLANKCIEAILDEAKKKKYQRNEKKPKMELTTSENFQIFNENVDLNITLDVITILQYIYQGVRIAATFKIQYVSVASYGIEDNTLPYVCFFAYNFDATGRHYRRCYVFEAKDFVPEIMQVLDFVIISAGLEEPDKNEDQLTIQSKMQSNKREKISSIQLIESAKVPNLSFYSEKPASISRTDNPLTYLTSSSRESSISQRLSNCLENVENNLSDNVVNQPWFHGKLDRYAAESLLHKPGQFLVRLSPHGENQFVLSAVTKRGDCLHIALVGENGELLLRRFKTIDNLICYCRQNKDYLPGKDVNLMLETPIERAVLNEK